MQTDGTAGDGSSFDALNAEVAALKREMAALGRSLMQLVGELRDAWGDSELAERADVPVPAAPLPMPDVPAPIDVLLDVGAHERPVTATQVAIALWHGEHGHGDVIRLGQLLGLASSVGLVKRLRRGDRYSGIHSRYLLAAA